MGYTNTWDNTSNQNNCSSFYTFKWYYMTILHNTFLSKIKNKKNLMYLVHVMYNWKHGCYKLLYRLFMERWVLVIKETLGLRMSKYGMVKHHCCLSCSHTKESIKDCCVCTRSVHSFVYRLLTKSFKVLVYFCFEN